MGVPMGILGVGAPGTAKTLLFKVLARVAGIPFITMKNTRHYLVGQSERNQNFSFELIEANQPTIVFVDEIDQDIQSRSTMGDNTGVTQHMMKRQFEFMSDDRLHGKVLWTAISNMPNLLDTAMLRRFAKRIPFFPPNFEGRTKILPALLRKMEIKARLRKVPFAWNINESFFQEFGWMTHRHLSRNGKIEPCDPKTHPVGTESPNELPFTGSQIEAILGEACELASNESKTLTEDHLRRALRAYAPPRDFLDYDKMSDLAILYSTSDQFIPEGKWRKRAQELRSGAPAPPPGTTFLT